MTPKPYIFDAYKGKSAAQLKQRCRELVRVVDRYQLIIAMMVEYAPNCLDRLPDEFREQAKRINAARRNDDDEISSLRSGDRTAGTKTETVS